MKIELNNIHIEGIGQVTGTVGFSLGLPASRFEPEEPAEVETIELVDADGNQVDEFSIWEDASKLEALESKIWELHIEQGEESRPDNDLVKVESVWQELHNHHPLMRGEGQ